MNPDENDVRKIKHGAEEAERISAWQLRHIPYTVYGTIPEPVIENDKYEE